MKSQESIKEWFNILEQRGEYSYFTIIEECDEGKIIESDFFHGDIDGIGGFLSIMKMRGEHEFLLPELPKRSRPHSLAYCLSFLKYLSRLPFYSAQWILKEEWKRLREKPLARAYKGLSKEDTEIIWRKAKEQGVGRNAYLLYHLDRAVRPYLRKSFFPRYWLIPVNLRRDFSHHEGNITGFVDAKITDSSTLSLLHQKLTHSLAQGDALGGHVGITIGRFIGPFFLKLLVHFNDYIQIRTGVFTNLGNWKTVKGEKSNSRWFGLPPVTKTLPFGAMTGSMNGEQSLAIVFHPSLTRSKTIADECLGRWVKFLMES